MTQRAKGTWVITGAASGFGRAFAQHLANRGDPLALWDVDQRGLAETASMLPTTRTHQVVVDVTDVTSVQRAATETLEVLGSVAHVIHSAGVLRIGPAATMDPSDYELMMRVNFLGSVHVAQSLLPQLRDADGRATLMLVSSVAGLRGFPELAGYSASKFALVGFAQALRDELHGTNVDLRVLCPPPGDTPMVQNLPTRPPVYKLSRLFQPEEIVQTAMARLDNSEWLMLVDLGSKALWRVGNVAPRLLDRIIRFASRR
ncbi:MAG: SDR family oxidoreductase [Myxococcota bacterium]